MTSRKVGGACVQSGYCCTVRPCEYGQSKPNAQACIYLAPPTTDAGQRYCELVSVIRFLEHGARYPMIGSGCSSTLGNEARDRVIQRLHKT